MISPYETGVNAWFLIGDDVGELWMWQRNDALQIRVCEENGTPVTGWHNTPGEAWGELTQKNAKPSTAQPYQTP